MRQPKAGARCARAANPSGDSSAYARSMTLATLPRSNSGVLLQTARGREQPGRGRLASPVMLRSRQVHM